MAYVYYSEHQCPTCGVHYGLDREFYAAQQAGKGHGWYCPNGHKLVIRESDAEKYRREAERLKQQIAQKDDEIAWQREQRKVSERQVAAAKGQITKLRKRANAGVCPCCNRTFTNMARHMKTKHPNHDPNIIDLGVEKAKRA